MIKRNLGLDILRSTAIIFVVIAHGMDLFIYPFLSKQIFNEIIYRVCCFLGCFGVEIFFVLSGFLIGRILLREMEHEHWLKRIPNFWIRRWLRTLPLYYLILFFMILNSNQIFMPWSHIFFVQNFSLEGLSFFPVSWSLAIEEWYYFLLPIYFFLILFNSSTQNRLKRIGLAIIYLILAITILRTLYVFIFDPPYDNGVRKMIFLQFDVLGIGLALAYLKNYKNDFYNKLKSKYFIYTGFLLGAISLFYFCLNYRLLDSSFWAKTGLFNMMALAIMFLLPGFESYAQNIGKRFFTSCSLYSYSIYLIHLPIFNLFKSFAQSISESILYLFLACLAVWIFSSLLYENVEKTFLKYRERFFSSEIKII